MSGQVEVETKKLLARAAVLKLFLQRGFTKWKEPTNYTPKEREAKEKERAEKLKIVEDRKEAIYLNRHNEVMGAVMGGVHTILQTLGASSNAPAPEAALPEEAPEDSALPEEEARAPEEEETQDSESAEEESEKSRRSGLSSRTG